VADAVQLAIDGSEKLLNGLTPRQQHALDTIAAMQPVASDELGAELCARKGKHPPDQRCHWCSKNGREVGAALRRKGLVRFRKRSNGWTLVGYRPADHLPPVQNAQREGFDEHGLPESF